jgi:hypothetical protein
LKVLQESMESQDLQDAMVVLVLMEFLEQPDLLVHLGQQAKQVLPVLQVKMARLDLQGLQVQLALPVQQAPPVQQVRQVRQVRKVRKVRQDVMGKMQLSIQ